jgi:hypothetical protein
MMPYAPLGSNRNDRRQNDAYENIGYVSRDFEHLDDFNIHL